MSPKAKKVRKTKGEKEVIKSEEMELSTDSEEKNESKLSTGYEAEDVEIVPGWTKPQIFQLVDEVEKQAPENDIMKFAKRTETLDWKMISIGKHNPVNCKNAWLFLQRRVRTHRSLKEMLIDAKSLCQDGIPKKLTKIPGAPKSPKNAFDIFHHEMKDSIKEQYPDMQKGQEFKYTSQLYKQLSAEEKSKYLKMAEEEKRQYDVELKKFYEDNPHLAPIPVESN